MKKLLAILLAVLMVFCLVACGDSDKDAADASKEDKTTSTDGENGDVLKVGFIYIGDESDEGWTYNHIAGQKEMEETYGDAVETICKYNVA